MKKRTSSRPLFVLSLWLLGVFTWQPALAQLPSCQIRLDALVERVGVASVAFTGTDTGVNNSRLRITPMGAMNIAGKPYTVWRLRNTNLNLRTLILSSGGMSYTFTAPPKTDTFVRSEAATLPAAHQLRSATAVQSTLIDTQYATTTAWSNSTQLADPLCSEPAVSLWIAHSAGISRVSPNGGSLLLDLPFAAGAEAVAVDLPLTNAWTYSNGRLRAFSPMGSILVDVPTVTKPANVVAKLAVAGEAGDIWLGVGQTLFRIGFDGAAIGQITLPGVIRDIQLDINHSRAWIATAAGVSVVRAGEPFEPAIVSYSNVTLSGGAYALAQDVALDSFWVNTLAGMRRFGADGLVQLAGPIGVPPATSVAVDGHGGGWLTASNQIYHFTSSGLTDWQAATSTTADGPAAELVSDPTTHQVWALSGATLSKFGVSATLGGAVSSGTVPRPGVVGARTHRRLALFTDRAAPVLLFISPGAGAFTNNRRPTIEVSYGDQGAAVDPLSLEFRVANNVLAVACSVRTATRAICVPSANLPTGSLDLSATVADVKGNRSIPVHRYFTVDITAPVITVTQPANGGYTNRPQGPIEGQLNEVGTVAIASSSVATDAFNRFSVPVTLAEGANSRTITAKDRASNQSQLSYQVTLDTRPPATPVVANVSTSAPVNGVVTVTGGSAAVEANATVRITNVRTNVTISAVATASGSFSAQLAALAGDALRIVVEDRATNTSTPVNVTVGGSNSAIRITVAEPLEGANVSAPSVLISGIVAGVTDARVTINGFESATSVSGTDTAFSDLVALAPGNNTIEIAATRPGGASGTAQVRVTYSVPNPYDVKASPTSGVGPLSVTFDVLQFIADDTLKATFDFENDGAVDQTIDTLGAPVSHLYQNAGTFTARVAISGSSGTTYSFDVPVTVHTSAQIDAEVQPTWTGFMDALISGDSATALTFVSAPSVARFASIMRTAESELPTLARSLSAAELVSADVEYAEYAVTRTVGTDEKFFLVQFVRDPDGMWRIAEM